MTYNSQAIKQSATGLSIGGNNSSIPAEPAEGTVAHAEWLAELSRQDKARWEQGQKSLFAGSAGNSSEQYHVQMMPTGPISSSDRDFRGAMGHGVGVAAPDGLVQVGSMRTDAATAEMLRQSMSAKEWVALTGRDYAPVDAKADQRSAYGKQTVTDMGPSHNVTDPDAALGKGVGEGEGYDESMDPESISTQIIERSFAEEHLETFHNADIAAKVRDQLIEDPSTITEEMRSTIGVSEDMVNDAIAHYVETADRVLKPVNSSTQVMSEFLSDEEAVRARKALLNSDLPTIRHLGQLATQRMADLRGQELIDWLSPQERSDLQLRLSNTGMGIVTLNGVTTDWYSAVSNGWIKLD